MPKFNFRIKLLLLILFFFIGKQNFSLTIDELSDKDVAYFKSYELRLQALQKKIFSQKNDSLKLKYNIEFFNVIDTVLTAEKSFLFPFDSLTEITRLYSPDGFFRIINWNIFKNDGTYLYYGFIQTFDKKKKVYECHQLKNYTDNIRSEETFVGSSDKWLGMLYYKIIDNKGFYTLLGWAGKNKLTQKKYVDVLYFKKNGDPVFGKDVFKMSRKNPRRIVFEYSADLVMSLKYYDDKKLIVFDHLAPRESFMEGQYQFYGPDFSFDAFSLHKQKWRYIEDIDVKNFKNKNDNTKRRKHKDEKPIYVPH